MPIKLIRQIFPLLLLLGSVFALHAQIQQPKPTPTPKPKPPKLTSHVVLVSLGGLRMEHLLNAESYGLHLPNLQALRSRGIYAVNVESVYPSQTMPAHATMLTGMLPVDHGVTAEQPFNEQTGAVAREPFLSAQQLKTETIWDAARREGLITAAVGFPLSAEAPVTFNLPLTFAQESGALTFSLAQQSALPPELAQDVPTTTTLKVKDAAAALQQDQSKAAAAAYLLEKHKPHLLLTYFASFEAAQRRYGPTAKEALAVLEQLDELVKRLLEAAERAQIAADTTFIIVSDRGLAKVEREFNPNAILVKKGWLTLNEKGEVVNWRARAVPAGGAAAVFVNAPQDEVTLKAIEGLFRDLHQKPDSPVWRILVRRDISRLGADPRAIIYLDAAPSFVMSTKLSGATIAGAPERAAAGYLPSRSEMRGTFIIAGKGVKSGVGAGARIEYARLIDVAPTIARLLGLELKTTRGRVLAEVFAQ